MTIYGYGLVSINPAILSIDRQEALALERFDSLRQTGELPHDAAWGEFFKDEPTPKPVRLRQRYRGGKLLAILRPEDVVIATSYDVLFANVADACEILE